MSFCAHRACSPLQAKKQKLFDAHGPAPAIKQSSSAGRVSIIPVAALHNVLKDHFRQEYDEVTSIPHMSTPQSIGDDDGVIKAQSFERHNTDYSPGDAIEINFNVPARGFVAVWVGYTHW